MYARFVRSLIVPVIAITVIATPAFAQETATAPAALSACELNTKFAPVSGQSGEPFADIIAKVDPNAPLAKYAGAYQATVGPDTIRLVVFGNLRVQYVFSAMEPGQDANAYRTVTFADGKITWSSGNFSYVVTPQDDGTMLLQLTRPNGSNAETILSACSVAPANTAENPAPAEDTGS